MLKKWLFIISQTAIGAILVLRITVVTLLLSLYNPNILKFTILAVPTDLFINTFIGRVNLVYYLKKFIVTLSGKKFNLLEENEFLKEIETEIRKYHLFSNFNKNKKVVFVEYTSTKPLSNYNSFPFTNWKSYILIPEKTDLKKVSQKVLLTHELAHCMGNDELRLIIMNIRIICICMPLLAFATTGLSVYFISTLILSLILYFAQVWGDSHAQIISNNWAMEILSSIDHPIDIKTTAEKLLLPFKLIESSNQNQSRLKRLQARIVIQFLEKARCDNRLINYDSPINIFHMTLLFLILALPVINVTNKQIINYDISWLTILFIFLAVAVFFIIVSIPLIFMEVKYKWQVENIIGC